MYLVIGFYFKNVNVVINYRVDKDSSLDKFLLE